MITSLEMFLVVRTLLVTRVNYLALLIRLTVVVEVNRMLVAVIQLLVTSAVYITHFISPTVVVLYKIIPTRQPQIEY